MMVAVPVAAMLSMSSLMTLVMFMMAMVVFSMTVAVVIPAATSIMGAGA